MDDHTKAGRVVASCKTLAHLRVADRYVELYARKHVASRYGELQDTITAMRRNLFNSRAAYLNWRMTQHGQ